MRVARERGVDATLCLSPLDPDRPEAVLFPSLSLGFIGMERDGHPDLEPFRHVRLDALLDLEQIRSQRPRLRADAKTKSALLDSATESLRAAKDLHDELEALYNPFVDFDKVRAAADGEIARVIGN
jgi:hypothetical protein